jgi:hypothetical protein
VQSGPQGLTLKSGHRTLTLKSGQSGPQTLTLKSGQPDAYPDRPDKADPRDLPGKADTKYLPGHRTLTRISSPLDTPRPPPISPQSPNPPKSNQKSPAPLPCQTSYHPPRPTWLIDQHLPAYQPSLPTVPRRYSGNRQLK